jgi:hypothetical protein
MPSHVGNTCFPVALMGGTLTLMQNQEVRSEYIPSGIGNGLLLAGLHMHAVGS